MTEIDPELRDKIIETHTDMKHVRRSIEKHDEELQEIKHDCDERLRELELNSSKIAGFAIAVGAGITLALNGALWLLGKMKGT